MRALVWAGLVGVFSSGTIFGAALPLRFETDNTGALISRNAVGALRLDRGGMTVMVRDASGHRAVAVTTRFLGGNPDVRPEGDGLMAARANYLLGSDARAWRTGAALYERAVYRHVYRGIDLVFHGSGDALEYDFVVANQSSAWRDGSDDTCENASGCGGTNQKEESTGWAASD